MAYGVGATTRREAMVQSRRVVVLHDLLNINFRGAHKQVPSRMHVVQLLQNEAS